MKFMLETVGIMLAQDLWLPKLFCMVFTGLPLMLMQRTSFVDVMVVRNLHVKLMC